MAQIFISYSRKDIDFARKLAVDLEKAGYEVWWDLTDLRGGDDWPRVIPAAIESSQYVIVVLSPNSAISDWVEKEYTQALSLHKKIIPIMLAQSNLPFALNTINYIDFTGEDYAASLNRLLVTLGYSGELVTPAATLPMLLRKYAFPIMIGILLLLVFISSFLFTPGVPPTPTITRTSTVILPSATVIFTTETNTSTVIPTASQSATITLSPTLTLTTTQSPTFTPSPTNQPLSRLGLCITSDFANSINVRSGPGTIYAPLGDPLVVGTCLFFGARNEEATWLQIAPNQSDTSLKQYEGGWIYRELLGLKPTSSVELPVVTLTPTPTPSETPTITPTFTRMPSETPTFTPAETETPTETPTP
ncbi:MAG TPA: toll/interleukin-1 receptor domain-containing protein [Anaerolineales bacterium]|nr:toll/interleukin-1 receptor domain-containing protein [Anaerolineales bacterium]